jgi:hypothetical protein
MTHESTTDPDAKLHKKAEGRQSKPCYLAHLLVGNQNIPVVNARITKVTGGAESQAAIDMLRELQGTCRISVDGLPAQRQFLGRIVDCRIGKDHKIPDQQGLHKKNSCFLLTISGEESYFVYTLILNLELSQSCFRRQLRF